MSYLINTAINPIAFKKEYSHYEIKEALHKLYSIGLEYVIHSYTDIMKVGCCIQAIELAISLSLATISFLLPTIQPCCH